MPKLIDAQTPTLNMLRERNEALRKRGFEPFKRDTHINNRWACRCNYCYWLNISGERE